jgi:hypothetical protein
MDTTKTYPKSRTGSQCIGPCYQPGTQIVHPITLEYVYNTEHPFCPVQPYEFSDPETGKKYPRQIDACSHPTENKDLSGKEYELNILVPSNDFNPIQFLKIYYNIFSFEDAIEYITNKKYLPILTRMRIADCALKAYGYELNIIDHRTVDFFIETANKFWIDELLERTGKYVIVEDDRVKFGKANEKDRDGDANRSVKIKFLKSKFINNDEMFKFLMRYIKSQQVRGEWAKIKKHTETIKENFVDYAENKIKMTIG